MKTLRDVQVGDTVLQFYGWNQRDTVGRDEKVVKITRTHIHLLDGTRYRIEDGVQTGTQYSANHIYPNREAYEYKVRMTAKWDTLTRSINGMPLPEDVTEEELDRIMWRFGVKL